MRKIGETLARSIKSSSYRMTEQRRKILRVLEAVPGSHPSASHIFERVSTDDRNVSISTVYNTLNFLTRLGIIKVIEFESSENRYELNLEPHINLICHNCGIIEDYPQEIPPPRTSGNNGSGFKVSDFRFEYYGTCTSCEAGTAERQGRERFTAEVPCGALSGTR